MDLFNADGQLLPEPLELLEHSRGKNTSTEEHTSEPDTSNLLRVLSSVGGSPNSKVVKSTQPLAVVSAQPFSFCGMLTVPSRFIAHSAQNVNEARTLIEIAMCGAQLDAIVDSFESEVKFSQIIERAKGNSRRLENLSVLSRAAEPLLSQAEEMSHRAMHLLYSKCFECVHILASLVKDLYMATTVYESMLNHGVLDTKGKQPLKNKVKVYQELTKRVEIILSGKPITPLLPSWESILPRSSAGNNKKSVAETGKSSPRTKEREKHKDGKKVEEGPLATDKTKDKFQSSGKSRPFDGSSSGERCKRLKPTTNRERGKANSPLAATAALRSHSTSERDCVVQIPTKDARDFFVVKLVGSRESEQYQGGRSTGERKIEEAWLQGQSKVCRHTLNLKKRYLDSRKEEKPKKREGEQEKIVVVSGDNRGNTRGTEQGHEYHGDKDKKASDADGNTSSTAALVQTASEVALSNNSKETGSLTPHWTKSSSPNLEERREKFYLEDDTTPESGELDLLNVSSSAPLPLPTMDDRYSLTQKKCPDIPTGLHQHQKFLNGNIPQQQARKCQLNPEAETGLPGRGKRKRKQGAIHRKLFRSRTLEQLPSSKGKDSKAAKKAADKRKRRRHGRVARSYGTTDGATTRRVVNTKSDNDERAKTRDTILVNNASSHENTSGKMPLKILGSAVVHSSSAEGDDNMFLEENNLTPESQEY